MADEIDPKPLPAALASLIPAGAAAPPVENPRAMLGHASATGASVVMRVTDPFGIAFMDADGNVKNHERGEVITVPADVARQLYRDGKAVPEEMRPPGAPAGVEKR